MKAPNLNPALAAATKRMLTHPAQPKPAVKKPAKKKPSK
jgi:hypothetical protein